MSTAPDQIFSGFSYSFNGYYYDKIIQESTNKYYIKPYTVNAPSSGNDDLIIRVDSTGQIDNSFSLKQNDIPITTVGTEFLWDFIKLPNGQLIITYNKVGGGGVELNRINTDGSVDTGFTTNLSGGTQIAYSSSDDTIVSNSAFAILKFLTDGTLDNTFTPYEDVFGVTGLEQLFVADDGKIIFFERQINVSPEILTLKQLNSDGTLNTTFSGDSVNDNQYIFREINYGYPDKNYFSVLLEGVGFNNDEIRIYDINDGSLFKTITISDEVIDNFWGYDSNTLEYLINVDVGGPSSHKVIKIDNSGNTNPSFQVDLNQLAVSDFLVDDQNRIGLVGQFDQVNSQTNEGFVLLNGEYYATASFSATTFSHDYGNIESGSTFPVFEIFITNTGNLPLTFTATASTNFIPQVTGFTIPVGGFTGVGIEARTANLGLHDEGVVFFEPNTGGFIFTGISTVFVQLFELQFENLDFGTVEYGNTGLTLSNRIENETPPSISLANITFANTPQYDISGITSPLAYDTSTQVPFNVVYANDFPTLGAKSDDILFDATTGGSVNLNITMNLVLLAPLLTNGISYNNKVFLDFFDLSVYANIDGFNIYRDGVLIGSTTGNTFVDDFSVPAAEKPNYDYQVSVFITGVGESPLSNIINVTISSQTPPDFCNADAYGTANESTCSASDGNLTILDYAVYSTYYNFQLTDIDGNSYPIDGSGVFNNLSANYYFLKATPISPNLREPCEIDFIQISDSGTYQVTGITVSSAICGGFNQKSGRAIVQTDISGNWSYKLYNQRLQLVDEEIGGNGALIITNLAPDFYYLVITSDVDGCVILYSFVVPEEKSSLSVPSIQKIYITEYSTNIDFNFWSSENDPDYFPAIDTLEFISTKVANYTQGLTWYAINANDLVSNFTQTLNKVDQGFIFNDVLQIGVPRNNQRKWEALKQVLAKRWIVIFQDNNQNWWTFGYESGAEAVDYTFASEDGGFRLGFSAISKNKLISAIDEEWVKQNVDFIDEVSIVVSENLLVFNTIFPKTSPPSKTFTISNNGNVPVNLSLTGTSGFNLLSPTNVTVSPNSSIIVQVGFTPQTLGLNNGKIIISSLVLDNDIEVNCQCQVNNPLTYLQTTGGFGSSSSQQTQTLNFGLALSSGGTITETGVTILNLSANGYNVTTTGMTNGLSTTPNSLFIGPNAIVQLDVSYDTNRPSGVYTPQLEFRETGFPTLTLDTRIILK